MMRRLISILYVALTWVTPAVSLAAHDPVRFNPATVVRPERARASYQRDRNGNEKTERITRTLKVGSTGELALSNISGDIIVTGGGGNEIRLEAVKRASDHSDRDAKRQLNLVTVEFDERAERAEVRTVYARGERRINVSVDYTVSVPSMMRLTLKSISGNVKVTGVKGELRAESVSGNVAVDGASRVALLKSVSGNVDISSTGTAGDLVASSVSGSLVAKGLKARSIDFGTVSGDVILSGITCSRANIRSVSGSLEYAGSLAKGGRYEMKSHSGDVRLALVGDVGFEISATSFSGNVRSDLPITLRTRDPESDHGSRSRRSSRAVHGLFGDGSAVLDVTTFSGNIIVTRP